MSYMFTITPTIREVLSNIENDIETCGKELSDLNSRVVSNLLDRFDDNLERSIALLVFNSFTFYDWETTKTHLVTSVDKFLAETTGQKVIFLFHREQSSSTNQNSCHEKSSFFFTLLAMSLRKELADRAIGFACSDLININPKNIPSDAVYCIVEDSIYSGSQLNNFIAGLDKKIDKSKVHVVCPFVRELFIDQSTSKPYKLHFTIAVPSLAEQLNSQEVMTKTCSQIEKIERTNPGAFDNDQIKLCKGNTSLRILDTIFPGSLKLTSVFFSSKIADQTSIPLNWLLNMFGLAKFSLDDSESFIANQIVKNSKEPIFACMRGMYKFHNEQLGNIFNSIFENQFSLKKKSIRSRLINMFKN